MNEDRLERIEAKLDALLAAMDHASGAPEPGKHTYWRTKPEEAEQSDERLVCRNCWHCARKDETSDYCRAHAMKVPINNVVIHCGRYEPKAKPVVRCEDCRHWCSCLTGPLPSCGRYEPMGAEPEPEPEPGKLICCRDCRHWSPDEEARLGECSVTLASTYGNGLWPGGCGHYQAKAEPTPAMYCGHCHEGICNLDHLECKPINSCSEAKVKANWPPKPEPPKATDCRTCKHCQSGLGFCIGWYSPTNRCDKYEPTS